MFSLHPVNIDFGSFIVFLFMFNYWSFSSQPCSTFTTMNKEVPLECIVGLVRSCLVFICSYFMLLPLWKHQGKAIQNKAR